MYVNYIMYLIMYVFVTECVYVNYTMYLIMYVFVTECVCM